MKTVTSFKEKPGIEIAREYLANGCYAWNSGIFIWKASSILEKLREYAPEVYEPLMRINECLSTECETEAVQREYPLIKNISIDYAVMEPSAARGDVLMIEGDFDWHDVGSWDMLDTLHAPNRDGNICVGDILASQAKNNTAYSSGRCIAMFGVENLIVVETPDAVMVCRKDMAQDIKRLVETVQDAERDALL